MDVEEQGGGPAPNAPVARVPSMVWGAGLALLAACAFVTQGYYEMNHPEGGCDGGTCVVAFYLGIAKAIGALVLGFPLGSLLIAGVRRVFRFWYAPVFWLKRR